MSQPPESTAAPGSSRMPRQVKYIVGNEAAERFSYYGMNSILVPFMTHQILSRGGAPDLMTESQANVWYHFFHAAVYYLPVLGALLADAVWGKYRTIFWLSIVYCFGHLALALDHTRLGLAVGLGLISLGAGGIKPCVSANVGDQFGPANQHLLPRVFSWFYFAINFGSAFSTMLVPYLLEHNGPQIAFGLPGVLMLIATVIFWIGRKQYIRIPPLGLTRYCRELVQKDNLKALANLLILVPFAAMFWALWDQNSSSWLSQAEHLNRNLFGKEFLPAQIQTANPVFILTMLPLFSYVIYPALERVVRLNPLRKFGAGLFTATLAFLVVAWIQHRIDAGQRPHVGWQLLAFFILTAAEVMVSVTHLEFAYTQAPRRMKSLVMCTYLGAIGLGNTFVGLVNYFIQNPDHSSKLSGTSYFMFFAWVMLGTAVLFAVVAPFYRGRTFIQGEAEAA